MDVRNIKGFDLPAGFKARLDACGAIVVMDDAERLGFAIIEHAFLRNDWRENLELNLKFLQECLTKENDDGR